MTSDQLSIGSFMREKAGEAMAAVSSTVVPLYRYADGVAPAFIGSGVLLRTRKQHFLLTAAHVLDEAGDGPLLPFDDAIRCARSSVLYKTPLPAAGRFHDPLDLGILPLTVEDAQALTAYAFVDERHVSYQTEPSQNAVAYSLLGFPETSTHENRLNRTARSVRKHWFDTECGPEVYRWLKVNLETHLLIRHNRKLAHGPKGNGPPFRLPGMSGGGIWQFHLLSSYTGTAKPLLSALFIEKNPRYGRALVGVRMAEIMRALAWKFHDVIECLPGHLLRSGRGPVCRPRAF